MEQQPPASPLGSDVAVTHILVVADPQRSRDFWVDVLGAQRQAADLRRIGVMMRLSLEFARGDDV